MSYERLKWITFGVAAAALVLLQFIFFEFTDWFLGPLPMLVRVVLRSGAVICGVFAFNEYVFLVIARVHDALERERERLAALHQASQTLASLVGLERNLTPTLEIVRRITEADLVAWFERDAHGPDAACRVMVGEPRNPASLSLRQRVGQGLVGRSLAKGRTVVVEDASRLPSGDRPGYPLMQSEELRTAIAAPAGTGQAPVGTLVLGWRQMHPLQVGDRAFLENVANQLGVAVDNWRLYRETQRVGALEERDRLAREMHDGLAQALTYLKLKAETAQQHAAAGRWATVSQGLEDIRRASVEALGDVRQAIVDLRAASHGHGGDFLSTLAAYLHTWSQLNDIEVELIAAADDLALEDEAEVQVMRILQESLANVRKHAGARRACVRIAAQEDGGWIITVEDDGHGFDPHVDGEPGHFGLTLMQERASMIGATVEISSRPGSGTRVTLVLPPQATTSAAEPEQSHSLTGGL